MSVRLYAMVHRKNIHEFTNWFFYQILFKYLENCSSYSMKKVVFYIKYSIPFSELTNTRIM